LGRDKEEKEGTKNSPTKEIGRCDEASKGSSRAYIAPFGESHGLTIISEETPKEKRKE